MPPSKNKKGGAKNKKDAVVEFEDPLNEKTLQLYLSQHPGMTLEALAVPDSHLSLKSAQLSEQPPPSAYELFKEHLEDLANRKGWNASCHQIWFGVLPWEQHFQWTNLSSDLREEHRKIYRIESKLRREKVEMPPTIPGDEAMLSKLRTGDESQESSLHGEVAEPLVTSDKRIPLNDGSIPSTTPEAASYTPGSNGGPSSPFYVEPSTRHWYTSEDHMRFERAAAIYAQLLPPPPNYGSLDENIKFLLNYEHGYEHGQHT